VVAALGFFLISTSVTQQFQKCHNGTSLFLLWYCNRIPKTVAAIAEIRFGTEKTLAKHIPPILRKTVKAAVAPVCRFLLWGRVNIPPHL